MKTSSFSAFVTLLVVASTCLLVGPRGAAATEAAPILSACDGKRGCPSRILLNRARGLDTLSFRGLVALPDGFVPAQHALEVTLAHAGGEIFHATLAPGELRRTKRRWLHHDGAARSRGGLSRVELRALRGGGWRVSLIGHGDMAAATLAEMGLELTIGGHVFLVVAAWDEREFGWLLHLGSDATPTPTPVPTAAPTATPAPTASPSPAPTATPAPTASPSPAPTATPTPAPTASPSPAPTATPTPAPTASPTPAPTASPTPAPTATPTPAPTASPSPAPTATPTPAPTASPTPASTATPTPAPTASPSPAPTATPTPAPTASPSPAPTLSCQSATVTIATSYEPQVPPDFVAGVTTTLDYPGGLLDIPGVGNAASVLARVTNVSGTNGLFSAGDQDASGDGFDDRIGVGLISTSAAIAPGSFARVVFDCVAGAPRPTLADFACTPDVSSLFGTTLEASCAVVDLQVSPP